MSDDSTNPSAPLPSLGAPPAAATAPSNNHPAVNTVPIIDNFGKRGEALLTKTLGALNKHGRHKDSILLLEIKKKLKKIVDVIHEVMAKAGKFVVDDNGTKCLPLTALNLNKELWNKTGSYFFLLGDRKKVGAAFSESEGGFYVRIMDQFDEEEQELKDDNAFVLMTLDDMMKLAGGYSELEKEVVELMQICPAFIGFYDDTEGQHRKKLFEHFLIAVFETYFAFVIDGTDPGYIAERILNLGSEAIWRYLTPPSLKLNEVAIEWLSKLDPKDLQLYVLETWEPYMSAIRAYIREKDMYSNAEVIAMLRDDLFQWYLNRHTLFSIWGGGGSNRCGTCLLEDKPFPDAVSCPIFAEVKDVAESILHVMDEHRNKGISLNQAKSQFESLLNQIATKHTKAYINPGDESLQTGGEKMLSALIKKAESQPKGTALITTEKYLVERLSKKYWENITRGAKTCVVKTVMLDDDGEPIIAGTLYKIPLDGVNCNTLLIFVGCSPHVTLGYGSTMPTRLSQASKQIATSSVLEEAGLIDEGSTDKLIKRFRFFFINTEGAFGNLLEDVLDSKRELRFYFAARLTLPLGYYIQPIRTGVVALADAICPGMLKHHAVALMVIMGYDNFCNFLRLHCDLELGPAANLRGKLEEMSEQRGKLLQQRRRKLLRLARFEIMEILRKKPEQRTEEDFENLEESRTLIDSSHTTQQYDDAKILIATLDENSTKDDFTEVAEEVYKLLTDHVTDRIKFGKLRRFYQEMSVDLQSVRKGVLAATLQIQFREKLGGETNANPFHAPSAAVEELVD